MVLTTPPVMGYATGLAKATLLAYSMVVVKINCHILRCQRNKAMFLMSYQSEAGCVNVSVIK